MAKKRVTIQTGEGKDRRDAAPIAGIDPAVLVVVKCTDDPKDKLHSITHVPTGAAVKHIDGFRRAVAFAKEFWVLLTPDEQTYFRELKKLKIDPKKLRRLVIDFVTKYPTL
jgi:hypothetical protein